MIEDYFSCFRVYSDTRVGLLVASSPCRRREQAYAACYFTRLAGPVMCYLS